MLFLLRILIQRIQGVIHAAVFNAKNSSVGLL